MFAWSTVYCFVRFFNCVLVACVTFSNSVTRASKTFVSASVYLAPFRTLFFEEVARGALVDKSGCCRLEVPRDFSCLELLAPLSSETGNEERA